MECEVKWALESITTNKAGGGDGISVELFQILKDDAVKVLHSICQQIWETHQWPQDWKTSVFIPIPKKGNAKEYSNYCTKALISHANKVMLKILQARLQQYMNREIPHVQAGLRKDRVTRDQIANIRWVKKKQKRERIKEKHLLLLCRLHQSLWLGITANWGKFLKRWDYQIPYLLPEKPVCRSRSNHLNCTWHNGLVPNSDRSLSRMYIVTLLI